MYLDEKVRVALAEFLTGGVWMAARRALEQRRPAYSEPNDSSETAAHRAFTRKGYEQCLEDILKLAIETEPSRDGDIPATLTDPRD